MSLFSRQVPHFLGGVSQEPPRQRHPSRGSEQINGLSDPLRGLTKRPPLVPGATLGAVKADPFTYTIKEGADDEYDVIVAGENLEVRTASAHTPVTVHFPDGKAYLKPTSTLVNNVLTLGPPPTWRATTIKNRTYLLNQVRKVLRSSEKSKALSHEALVWVREGAPDVPYTIFLDGVEKTFTPAGATVGDISTENIAQRLINSLNNAPSIDTNFTLLRFGSTIHIARKDGNDFSLSVSDGLGDQGLVAIKETVQSFSDLPKKAKHGFVVEVEGSPETDADNFFVKYDDSESPAENGVWRETIEPGSTLGLKASTMPHVLEWMGARLTGKADAIGGNPTLSLNGDPSFTADFPEDAVYPQGIQLTLELDAFTYNYTPATVESGSDVSTAFANILDASADWNLYERNDSKGIFSAARTDNATMTFARFAKASLAATQVFMKDLSLTTDELANLRLVNETDGSKGTVVSNTATTITVDALSGGSTNTFEPGDDIRVEWTDENYFVFRQGSWTERTAGPLRRIPLPSFVDREIRDIFSSSGRLGLISGSNLNFSAAGEPFRFFRKSAVDLFDDDPIDVSPSSVSSVPQFHAAAEWSGGLYLIDEVLQVEVSWDPILTPSTISLRTVGAFETSPSLRPTVVGQRLFMGRETPSGLQVREFGLNREGELVSVDTTARLPSYISGRPMQMVGDEGRGLLVVNTASPVNSLFVCSLLGQGDNADYSWSRWDFSPGATIETIAFNGTALRLLTTYADATYIEKVGLAPYAADPTDLGQLDRFGTATGPTINLPYAVEAANQGQFLAFRTDTWAELPVTWNSTTQIDVGVTTEVAFGFDYTSRFDLTRLFPRDPRTEAVQSGRLQVQYLEFFYEDTSGFSVEVTPQGRTTKTTSIPSLTTPARGSLRVPVKANAEGLGISLVSSSPHRFNVSSMEWEALYYNRTRPL